MPKRNLEMPEHMRQKCLEMLENSLNMIQKWLPELSSKIVDPRLPKIRAPLVVDPRPPGRLQHLRLPILHNLMLNGINLEYIPPAMVL